FTDTSWDAVHNKSSVTRDIEGRLLKKVEYWGATPVTNVYAYQAFGQLRSITDDKGHMTVYGVDTQGRLINETDPETSISFSWQFGYNGFGDLITKKHVANTTEVTSYSYDSLGRVLKRTGPEGTWRQTWDTTQPNGIKRIGKVADMTSPDSVKTT